MNNSNCNSTTNTLSCQSSIPTSAERSRWRQFYYRRIDHDRQQPHVMNEDDTTFSIQTLSFPHIHGASLLSSSSSLLSLLSCRPITVDEYLSSVASSESLPNQSNIAPSMNDDGYENNYDDSNNNSNTATARRIETEETKRMFLITLLNQALSIIDDSADDGSISD
jgi:hypothetical protein